MHITRLLVHRSRPSTRCSSKPGGHRWPQPRIRKRRRANRRRRAQGRCPPPDARTRARSFNAPVAFPPNTLVTGSVIENRHLSHHPFCSFPHQTNQGVPGRRKAGMECLIGTPSRYPRSTLWTTRHCTAPDPRPDMVPSWGRVGRRLTTSQPPHRICRYTVQACDR